MKYSLCSCSLLILITLSCASCSDDPKLVEKREKQKFEIARLKGELALIEERLKNLPPDVSTDLIAAKQLSDRQTAEVAGLEKEIAGLEARKKNLQKEFDVYRAKYQVK